VAVQKEATIFSEMEEKLETGQAVQIIVDIRDALTTPAWLLDFLE
jgi:hypothetical protein